jgi:hypothetical protein
LDTLAVKGRAPRTGYEREQFGQSWSDDVSVTDGHNGCDTRNDILRRDLTDVALKPDTRGCVVLAGTLDDPYTRQTISFTRGPDTSAQVQIDHVVALSDAWQKGAQQLDADRRRDFANDPRNLQAVAGSANQRKSDGDAATWLPPNKSYRCTYVSRQIEVKSLYRLWVTPAEKDAMTRVLTACSGTAIPTSETASPPPTKTDRVAPASYFPNCAAARAAGRLRVSPALSRRCRNIPPEATHSARPRGWISWRTAEPGAANSRASRSRRCRPRALRCLLRQSRAAR